MFYEIFFDLFFLFFLLTSLFRRLEKLYIKKIGGVWGEGCPIGRNTRLTDDGKRSDALDVSGSKTALPVETMSSSDSLLVVPNTTFACLLLILFLLFCTLERSGSVFALSWTPFGILKGSCGGTWAFF